MTYGLLALRYWKYIAGIGLLAIILIGMQQHDKRVYERGKQDGITQTHKKITAMQAKLAEAERRAYEQSQEYAQQMAQASEQYQAQKAQREDKERVRYVEVQKIVEKPVYINNCIDSDGLHQLNSAIKGK